MASVSISCPSCSATDGVVHKSVSDDVGGIYLLAAEYERYGARMASCGGLLRFGWATLKETGETRLRLREAHFCRVRHCPVCQWRRSLMWQACWTRSRQMAFPSRSTVINPRRKPMPCRVVWPISMIFAVFQTLRSIRNWRNHLPNSSLCIRCKTGRQIGARHPLATSWITLRSHPSSISPRQRVTAGS